MRHKIKRTLKKCQRGVLIIHSLIFLSLLLIVFIGMSAEVIGDACSPGTTQSCGNCGTQTYQSNNQWGTCTGEGVCSPGTTQSCGDIGTQTCTSLCMWGVCTYNKIVTQKVK